MKNDKRKNNNISRVSSLLIFTSSLLIFLSSCPSPFQAGLGAVVDIRPPTVILTDPSVKGAALYGTKIFRGTAEDDYMLDRVELMVTNYPDLERNVWREWTRTALTKSPQNKGVWELPVDTTQFPDGYLKVMVRVYDAVRKDPSVTDEYVFTVRNDLPKIKLTSPSILEDEGGADGVIRARPDDPNRAPQLNYGYLQKGYLPSSINFERPAMAPRSAISGTIVYEEGIYIEPYNDATPDRYPPQIRLWRIIDQTATPNDNPADGIQELYFGEWPSEAEVPWNDFRVNDPQSQFTLTEGIGRYGFSTKVPDAAGFYGIEVRAQSESGRVKFHYPRDYWATAENAANWDANPPVGADKDFIMENRYVLVYVSTTEQPVIVKFWNLEDILGEETPYPDNWVAADSVYTNLTVGDDEPHRYVDKSTVFKNGSFTVRFNAQHAQGIESALAFWDSSDERGVFIWDTDYTLKTTSSDTTTISIPTDEPFSHWGYIDPKDPTARNFIFTYNPAAPGNIWKYNGNLTDWNDVRLEIIGDKLEDLGKYGFEQVKIDPEDPLKPPLKEDSYTIVVYAVSTTSAYARSLERQVRLDMTPPTVEVINAIRGAEKFAVNAEGTTWEAIVNGVIQPTLRRVTDTGNSASGMRTATKNYFKERSEVTGQFDGPLGHEKRYFLVQDTTGMDKILAYYGPNYWPAVSAADTPSTPLTLPVPVKNDDGTVSWSGSVTVYRHGPVYAVGSGDGFRFKTSAIYEGGKDSNNDNEDVLLAPSVYWLYVLARDNAFNVGRMDPVKITVTPATDIPAITVVGLNAIGDTNGVNKPNYVDQEAAGGFMPPNLGYQNRGVGNGLRLQLSDDDAVNLGVSGGALSKVIVTLSGVTQDEHGNVTIRTGTASGSTPPNGSYLRTVPDSVIKAAFEPPSARYKDATIPQSALVDVLYGTVNDNPYNYLFNLGKGSTLPDGIYNIKIAIEDDASFKLQAPDEKPQELGTVKVESANKEIWIFVDATPPELVIDGYTEDAKWIVETLTVNPPQNAEPEQLWLTNLTSTNGYTTGIQFTGTISDRNGPVRAKSFTITNSAGQSAQWGNNVKADIAEVNASRTWTSDGEEYRATFTAPVHIHDSISGDFTVTLTVEDRFGRETTLPQKFKRDRSPPTVNLRTPITTFRRQYADIAGSVGNVNYTRLANGVGFFEYSAQDDVEVGEVRYWLIKSITATSGTPPNEVHTTTSVFPTDKDLAWNYLNVSALPNDTFTTDSSAKVKYGRFSAFSRTVYIDTRTLDDNTEYSLYIMAQDTGGNISQVPAAPLQTIFVRQEEDAPWFVSNTLTGAAGETLRASLVIHDDDTFYAAKGNTNTVRDSTVRIRATITDIPDSPATNWTDTGDGHMTTYGYIGDTVKGTTWYEVPANEITAIGKNIQFSVDLKTAFPTILTTFTTGRAHYIVEVTDSWVDKFINENGTEATGPTTPSGVNTVSRRKHYTFESDLEPAKARIFAPDPAVTPSPIYGPDGKDKNNNGFAVTGAISDANLKMYNPPNDPYEYYIIGIQVDSKDLWITTPTSTSSLKPFQLGTGAGNGFIHATGDTPPGIQTGQDVDGTPTPAGNTADTRVNFTIPAADFLAAIDYTNENLSDGRHTLILVAEDFGSRRGSSSALIFFKDTTPPTFTFTRGFNDEKEPLPTINTSTNATPSNQAWWTAMSNMSSWSNNAAIVKRYRDARDSLPVISYEKITSGTYTDETMPAITGTFTDELSTIARGANTFRIMWDANPAIIDIPATQLGDDGKTVSWRVYPTSNGQLSGTPLPDGVHSIKLSIADAVNNVMDFTPMYGFRVVSTTPEADLTHVNGLVARTGTAPNFTPNSDIKTVYGDLAGNNFNIRSFDTTGRGTNNTNPVGGNAATNYFTAANHGLVVGDTVVVGGVSRYVLYVNGNNFKLSTNYVWPTDNAVWNPAAGNITVTANVVFAITGEGESPNLSDMRIRVRYTDSNSYTAFERSVLRANPQTITAPGGAITTNPQYIAGDTQVANPETWTIAANTPDKLTWTLPIPRSYLMFAGGIPRNNTNRIRPGNYEIMVITVDSAGKHSEETNTNTWQFVVDSETPTFRFNLPSSDTDKTVSNAARDPAHWLTNTAARNVLDGTAPIRGHVSDANTLANVEIQLANWNYASGTGVWRIYNFSNNTWVENNTGNLNAATSWQALPAPTSSEYPVSWDFPANIDLDTVTAGIQQDGYYSVRLRARDTATAVGGTTGWGTGMGGTASNNGNPDASHYLYFFIDTKGPTLTPPDDELTTFSSRYLPNHAVTFRINATDPNWFEKMVVSVERINTSLGVLPGAVTLDTTAPHYGNGTWTAAVTMAFTPREVIPASGSRPLTGTGETGSGHPGAGTGLPDGAYRLVFTATDLAGKTARDTRTITLDNRAPSGAIAEPRFRDYLDVPPDVKRFSSEIKNGGESFTIEGSTADAGDNGSATGPKEVWYRIGYGTRTALPTLEGAALNIDSADPDIKAAAINARSAQIAAWVENSGDGLGLPTNEYDRGSASNSYFEAAASKKTGSLWFKYAETGATYDMPTYFRYSETAAGIPANPDPYSWSMIASEQAGNSVATNYAIGGLTMRGTAYATVTTAGSVGVASNGQYLAREIPVNNLPPGDLRNGVFSLPLVIRVVDNAGNVFYELRDIWLFPNGDNPRVTTFLNPADRVTNVTAPRGGQFNIDGIALDNVSVRTVIYRVRTDATSNTTTNPGIPPVNYQTAVAATSPATNVNNDIQNNTRYFTRANHGLVVGDTVRVGATDRYVLWVSGNNFKLSNTYTMNNPQTNVWNPNPGNASNQNIEFSNIVTTIPGMKWESHPEYNAMLARWNSYGTNGSGVTESNSATVALNQAGWYMADLDTTTFDPTMPWNFIFNAAGEITNRIAARGFSYPTGGSNNMIRVWVDVLVFDGTAVTDGGYHLMSLGEGNTNANNPRPYVREFYLTNAAPSITTKRISALHSTTPNQRYGNDPDDTTQPTAAPVAANYVRSGDFAIRATLSSTTKDISEISVRYRTGSDDASAPMNVPLSGTGPAGVTWNGTNRTGTLTYIFSTGATATAGTHHVRGGNWASSGGTMTVEFRVKDTSAAEATYTFEVGIDNFAPLADASWGNNYVAKNTTPGKVAGSDVSFLGRVFDYRDYTNDPKPEHRKIKEVLVWFMPRNANPATSGADYYHLTARQTLPGTNAGVGAATATSGIWTKPQATITWSTANPNNVERIQPNATPTPALAQASYYIPTNANYVKTLSAAPQTGVTWSPSTGDADVFWSFIQNTTVLPDGLITMHYVVVDQADNRSYYSQDMIVMNNYPQITKVTLWTNNTGEGAVFTSHEGNDAFSEYVIPNNGTTIPYASGYLDSGFISKNNVIGFGIDTIKGNGTLRYQARYVERYLVPLTRANMVAMANASAAGTAATLNYLPNTVTLNAQGILVNASGVAVSPAPGTASAGAFVNLYTIATAGSPAEGQVGNGSLGPDVWKLLGVPSTNPVAGSHFVFQAVNGGGGDNDVTQMNATGAQGFPSVYVYAYREVFTKTPLTPTPTDKVTPDQLNFEGATYFNGANKVNEAQANNPTNATTLTDGEKGTAYFLIKVWDTVDGSATPVEKDMLYDAVVIGMKVYVGDRRAPFARLYDLNPYMEAAVTGSNVGPNNQKATREEAALPTAVGANIMRGGLYNLGTARAPIKSGYIDPRSGTTSSTALRPWISNPGDPLNPYVGSLQKTPGTPDGFVTGDTVATTGTAVRDKVSGSVILRGLAWDDQLIDEIRVSIGGTSKLILKLWYVYPDDYATPALRGTKYSTNTPSAAVIVSEKLVRKMMPESDVEAWTFENIHWQTGHTVEWAYLWNTETLPTGRTRGGPTTNTAVSVIVRDLNGTKIPADPPPSTGDDFNRLLNASVTADTPAANPPNFHNTVGVDIVPYVTGFKRADKFATTRSRQGWYSFYQGETGIRVVGYNLGNSTNTAAPIGTIVNLNSSNSGNGTNLTGRAYTDTPIANNHNLPNEGHTFTIPTDANSGRIDVYVGSTTAVAANRAWNHSSTHTNKSWNKESSSLVTGSDLWINKPYAHIWRSTQSNTTPVTYFGDNTGSGGSWALDSPSMVLEYGATSGTTGETTGNGAVTGRLHGAWGIRENFGVYYGANDNNPRIRQQVAQDPLSLTDMAYYPSANNANNLTLVYVYQWDSLPNLLLRTHMKYIADSSGDPALGFNAGGTIVPFLVRRDDRGSPRDTYSWQNVRTSMTMANINTATFTVTNNGTNNTNPIGGNANSRYYTYANHGLAEGDTVRVGNNNHYVRWVGDVNGVSSFKLTADYSSATNNNVLTTATNITIITTSDNPYTPHGGDRDHQNAVAPRGGAGRVYTTGYDSIGKNVFFVERVESNNYPSNNPSGGANLPLFIDGGNRANGVNDMTALANYTSTATVPSTRAGSWSAIDYVTNGEGNRTVPVIAYYDETNDTLRLAYGDSGDTTNNNPNTNGEANRWTRRYVLPSNDALFRGSGKYVSMKVDKNNNIHLAFLNSVHNTVVYAVGTRTGAFTAYAIDNVVPGGTWTDIAVDNYDNPWITYGNTNRTGNYDGVRLAYKSTGTTGTATGAFTRTLNDPINTTRAITGWEALTMPADYTIAEDRLNIEAWPPTDRRTTTATLAAASPNGAWHAAVGYAGTDRSNNTSMFRVGYFFKPANAVVTAFQSTGN